MSEMSNAKSHYGLENHGLRNLGTVHWNLSTPTLIEHALRRQEGKVSKDGALVVCTGQHTGRSANDKFVVLDETTEGDIWWGKVNAPYEPARFDALFERMMAHLEGSELYVQDCYVGADPEHRLPVRIVNELAWHSIFARNMFVEATDEQKAVHEPQFTVINAPSFTANPKTDATMSLRHISEPTRPY